MNPAYTVEELDRLLAQWPRILSLAEGIGGSGSVVGGGAHSHQAGDNRYWADVVADITVAHLQLYEQSRLWYGVVGARMRGLPPSEYARRIRKRKSDVLAAHVAALQAMIARLEGAPL